MTDVEWWCYWVPFGNLSTRVAFRPKKGQHIKKKWVFHLVLLVLKM